MLQKGLVTESDLSKRLGVDQRVVADFRREALVEGRHWVKVRQGIWFTEAGVAEIEKRTGAEIARGGAIDGQPPSPPAEGADRGTGKEGARAADFTVWRCCPNPTWVKAWPGDGSPAVDVRVKNNRGMYPEMKLRGCVPDLYGRWVYPGRCPAPRRTA